MPPDIEPSPADVTGAEINAVLRLVKSLTGDGNAQLTILARAFVTACQSCQVDEATALPIVAGLFREPADLVPLE